MNTFLTSNYACGLGDNGNSYGGAAALELSELVIISDCAIASNTAENGGGGGVRMRNCRKALVQACMIANNTVTGSTGGGLRAEFYESVHISESTFIGNSAHRGGGFAADAWEFSTAWQQAAHLYSPKQGVEIQDTVFDTNTAVVPSNSD